MFAIALFGLRLGIADPDGFVGLEVQADLTAQEHHVPGNDGLAEIVVEILLGIGVLRVERPDAGVAHAPLVVWVSLLS